MMRLVFLRGYPAEVALIAPTVEAGVGVDRFAPETAYQRGQTIVFAAFKQFPSILAKGQATWYYANSKRIWKYYGLTPLIVVT